MGSTLRCWCLSFFVPALATAADRSAADPDEALLLRNGISTDAAGLKRWLRGLASGGNRKRAAELMARLSHSEYRVRQAAMRSLISLPGVPLEDLRRLAAGSDLEAAWRAKKILMRAKPQSRALLFAGLRVIARKPVRGLAAELIAAFAVCDEPHLEEAARRALAATVTPADEQLLRTAQAHRNASVRRSAVRALAGLPAIAPAAVLKSSLQDADDWVRYEAARGLARLRRRDCVPAFAKLLESADVNIRAASLGALRQLTGRQFGTTPYDKPAERAAAVARWKKWIGSEFASAKLQFPLRDGPGVELGLTVACSYNGGRVVVFDRAGKVLWEKRGSGPWGGQRLANGNILIAWYNQGRVAEYDPAGREVWAMERVSSPWNAKRLANGNTLIAYSAGVIEVAPSHKVVWRHAGHAADVQRLSKGNTLIVSTSGSVFEVTPAGKKVRTIAGLQTPYRAHRLPNGHTLIAEVGRRRVVEFAADDKTVVWSKAGLNSPMSAQRLSNGNTLIGDMEGVKEVTPEGKVVWQQAVPYCVAWRY